MMERRRSAKKSRSYSGTPRGSRNSQSSFPASSSGRPPFKERVRSAPLGIPQTEEQPRSRPRYPENIPNGGPEREGQILEPPSGTPSSPSSPTSKYYGAQLQRDKGTGQLTASTSRKSHGITAENDGKIGGTSDVQEVSLAVLGAPAVGKSTFVHCALDLKRPSTSPVASKKVSLEGQISIVRLFELGLDDVEVTSEQSMRWPERVGDESVPRIDGVLALYDVMNQSSIAPIPPLLSESFRSLYLCCRARKASYKKHRTYS